MFWQYSHMLADALNSAAWHLKISRFIAALKLTSRSFTTNVIMEAFYVGFLEASDEEMDFFRFGGQFFAWPDRLQKTGEYRESEFLGWGVEAGYEQV